MPVITAAIAYNKGYNPFLWILALPPIGLIVLLFLPMVDPRILNPKDHDYQASVGNWWGVILTALHVIAEVAWTVYKNPFPPQP